MKKKIRIILKPRNPQDEIDLELISNDFKVSVTADSDDYSLDQISDPMLREEVLAEVYEVLEEQNEKSKRGVLTPGPGKTRASIFKYIRELAKTEGIGVAVRTVVAAALNSWMGR